MKHITLDAAVINKRCLLLIIILISISCSKSDEFSTGPDLVLPPNIKIITVLGSSTAEGIGANPIDSSWVSRLRSRLSGEYKNVGIVNFGKGGFTTFSILPSEYTTADTSRNISQALKLNPDLVIINLPTNDVAKGYTDEEILDNYNIITKKVAEAKRQFIIISTQPRNFTQIDTRRRLMILNQKLEAKYPRHLVHVYSKLATPEYIINPLLSYGDGIHLNNSGHNVIYESVLNDSTFKNVVY